MWWSVLIELSYHYIDVTWAPWCLTICSTVCSFWQKIKLDVTSSALLVLCKRNPQVTDGYPILTHWGRVTHICVGNVTIIGSDNGLAPDRRQAIIWTNAGILFIGPLGTNFSEISIEIHKFSFKKMHLKTSSAKWRPFCLGLNVLRVSNAESVSMFWRHHDKLCISD